MKKYTRKDVTPELLSMAHNDSVRVEILEAPFRKEMPALSRSEDGKVLVCKVHNLDLDTDQLLIVPAVFESVLASYPDMIGGKFEIVNAPAKEGKNYRNIKVFELGEEPA